MQLKCNRYKEGEDYSYLTSQLIWSWSWAWQYICITHCKLPSRGGDDCLLPMMNLLHCVCHFLRNYLNINEISQVPNRINGWGHNLNYLRMFSCCCVGLDNLCSCIKPIILRLFYSQCRSNIILFSLVPASSLCPRFGSKLNSKMLFDPHHHPPTTQIFWKSSRPSRRLIFDM